MNPVSLLFDPRGAIGRGAFWGGLCELALVQLAAGAFLTRSPSTAEAAMTLFPVVGPTYLLNSIVGALGDEGPPLKSIGLVLLQLACLYPLACLGLKRLRDAGSGSAPMIVMGLLSLAIDASMAAWMYDVWDGGEMVIVPGFASLILTALSWTIFLGWIGARPSRQRTTPGSNRPQVKPAS
jgi:uncharacterized membrane protein YhaH (DUF805 family)